MEVIARGINSQFAFENLMEFDDCTSVGNAVSVTAANLPPDSSTISSIFLPFTRMFKVHSVHFQQKNLLKIFINGCGI
jgi:hypothetical protein